MNARFLFFLRLFFTSCIFCYIIHGPWRMKYTNKQQMSYYAATSFAIRLKHVRIYANEKDDHRSGQLLSPACKSRCALRNARRRRYIPPTERADISFTTPLECRVWCRGTRNHVTPTYHSLCNTASACSIMNGVQPDLASHTYHT